MAKEHADEGFKALLQSVMKLIQLLTLIYAITLALNRTLILSLNLTLTLINRCRDG
jgi:hypothetical protein